MESLKIAVFHNLPSSGALRALYDNMNILKQHGHHIDVYTTDIFANNEFVSIDAVSDNIFVYPINRSYLRKIIFNTLTTIMPSINISKTSRAYISFKDMKKAQKKIANDIDNNDYDIVLCEQDPLFSVTPALFEYLKTPFVYYCPQPYRNNDKILMKLDENIGKPFYMKIYNKLFEKKYINLDIEYAQYAKKIFAPNCEQSLLNINNVNNFYNYSLCKGDFIKYKFVNEKLKKFNEDIVIVF